MITRAAIYARVSSQAQREKHTIENQLRALPDFVKSQGWTLVETYVDDGRSAKAGKLEARDGFAQLLRDADAKRFDVLVVVDIDRLTRTDDMAERAQILSPFQRAGIDIVTPHGGRLDLRTFLGEFYVTMQAMFAAEENRKRAERIKAGKLRAIAEGRKPAGPTPYGWAYDRASGRWSIEEPAAKILREIFGRIAAGQSCVQVADDLVARDAKPAPRTGWTRAAVYRIVRKRTAVGEWEADKTRGAVLSIPPIVTEDEWHAASRTLFAHKRRGLVRTKHVYLLEGVARCGDCGAGVHIRSATTLRNGTRVAAAYICSTRKNKQACHAKIVRCDDIDERIWSALCEEIAQPDLLRALADAGQERDRDERDWKKDADGYRAHLARLEKVEGAVMARFRRGMISDAALDTELATLTRERKMVRDQLATAERALGATLSKKERLQAAEDTLSALRSSLLHATPKQRQALLRELALDGGIVISDGRARLDLRLLRSVAATSRDGRAQAGDGYDPRTALADHSDYRRQHGAFLRIRLVA